MEEKNWNFLISKGEKRWKKDRFSYEWGYIVYDFLSLFY